LCVAAGLNGIDTRKRVRSTPRAASAAVAAETVAGLYAPGALLLPTLSPTNRSDSAGIADYFNAFLKRHPTGTVTSRTILMGCNQAIDAGNYRFQLHEPEEQVDARFTFVYDFDGEQWRIAHHHSSLQPRP
jgi:uncharacterized protein (TIGR02246 family)